MIMNAYYMHPERYEDDYKLVTESDDTSNWLKQALIDLDKRDPLDALHDLEIATRLATKRFEATLK